MDQVRKISTFVCFCLMTVLLSGCYVGNVPEPPESTYTVVKFRLDDYSRYVLVEKEGEKYHTFTHYWNTKDGFDYTNLYEQLNKGYYTGRNCLIKKACAVTNILWKDFSPQDHGHYFSKEEIVDECPFSEFYSVPQHDIDDRDYYWSLSIEELRDQLNALIDSGDIEQYRVDLGY